MKRGMLCSRVACVLALAAVLLAAASGAWSDTDLMDLRSRTGSTLEWDPWSQRGLLVNRGTTVAFRVGLPWAVVDYEDRLDIGPVTRNGASIRFTDEGAELIAALLDPPPPERLGPQVAAIVIDPGHGGKDPGAVREHRFDGRRVVIHEKDIALAVGLRLSAMLAQELPYTRILMTRDEDVFVELEDRPAMANEALDALPEDGDIVLFVSVHANTVAFRTEPTGFEVWVLPKEHERTVLPSGSTPSGDSAAQPIFNAMLDEQINRESVVLANEILDGLEAHVGDRSPNRGLREEKWAVVRRARMPAVLVEVGYMSNPVEARRMLQPDYLNDLARGIYDGIRGFIEWFEAAPDLTE